MKTLHKVGLVILALIVITVGAWVCLSGDSDAEGTLIPDYPEGTQIVVAEYGTYNYSLDLFGPLPVYIAIELPENAIPGGYHVTVHGFSGVNSMIDTIWLIDEYNTIWVYLHSPINEFLVTFVVNFNFMDPEYNGNNCCLTIISDNVGAVDLVVSDLSAIEIETNTIYLVDFSLISSYYEVYDMTGIMLTNNPCVMFASTPGNHSFSFNSFSPFIQEWGVVHVSEKSIMSSFPTVDPGDDTDPGDNGTDPGDDTDPGPTPGHNSADDTFTPFNLTSEDLVVIIFGVLGALIVIVSLATLYTVRRM